MMADSVQRRSSKESAPTRDAPSPGTPGRVEPATSARVTAQIKTDGIVIEKGSRFKGLIEVGSDEEVPEVTPSLPGGASGSQKAKDDGSNPFAKGGSSK